MATMQNKVMSQRAANDQITQLLLTQGEPMFQSIASGSFTPNGANNTVNIPMRPVGFTRGFLLKITATMANSGSGAATLTPWGAANLISNVILTDLDNYQRINTTGWHLAFLNTAKEGFPFGAALLSSAMDAPIKYGNNFGAMSATATLGASTGTGTVQMYFWIPCSYGKTDLRGGIYTGVVNSTAFVQFTVNPTPGVTTGDATLAMYSGANTATTITNVQFNLYQDYIDQVPRYPANSPYAGRPILPPVAIRTQYRLINTALSAILANQDFPVPFTNFQSFLSASAIYDNAGVLNAGTDVNAWKLLAANTLQFFNVDAITQALRSRVRIETDWPLGSYMFDFRDAPIATNQAGNMQLILNPSSASAGAQLLVGWESFADVNTVLGAQSLPAS